MTISVWRSTISSRVPTVRAFVSTSSMFCNSPAMLVHRPDPTWHQHDHACRPPQTWADLRTSPTSLPWRCTIGAHIDGERTSLHMLSSDHPGATDGRRPAHPPNSRQITSRSCVRECL